MKRTIYSVLVSALLVFFAAEVFAIVRPAVQPLCQNPNYTCISVQKGESWENLFPDINVRDNVMRLNRMNINLQPGMVIAVPSNLNNLNYLDLGPFAKQIEPTGKKLIIVEPKDFAFGAYDEQGKLVHWGPVSMGRGWCADVNSRCKTPSGKFAVYDKRGAGCVSSKFPVGKGGAPTAFCMFFKGGYALHASAEVPGYHASHGCVRIFYQDAQWLNQQFIELPNKNNGGRGTDVIVRPYSV
jgi:L,D-transpeptidase ErfK/SrfK